MHVAQAARDPAGPYRKLDVFSHVLSLIENNYVETVDETKLLYGAIDGMVHTLDPHSTFMDPRSYAALKEETEGEYGGVGLEIGTRGGEVVVIAPDRRHARPRARGSSPATSCWRSTAKALRGWRESEAVRALMGPPGTKVTIKAQRAAWPEPRTFTLVRDVVRLVSVEEKLFDRKLGYVKIKTFQDRTDSYLRKALESLRAKSGGQLAGLVLDLRHNPGGLLDQAVKVADRFMDGGVIVTTKGRGGKHVEVERAQAKGTEPRYPLMVLVDGGTASASEIVAGALQDSRRAVLIGTRTFGKGSVQTVIELEDGSGLKLTVARYYTPSGRSIQERGITPDVWVKASAADDDAPRELNLPGHFKGEEGGPDRGGLAAAAGAAARSPRRPERRPAAQGRARHPAHLAGVPAVAAAAAPPHRPSLGRRRSRASCVDSDALRRTADAMCAGVCTNHGRRGPPERLQEPAERGLRSACQAGRPFDKRPGVTYSPAPLRADMPGIARDFGASMTRVEVLFLATYFLVLLILSIYGSHRYVMAYLFYKYKGNLPAPEGEVRHGCRASPSSSRSSTRCTSSSACIDAVARIDYPRDRLEIQVLDDSTDETQGIARARVAELRAAGPRHLLHPPRRTGSGFKAGALPGRAEDVARAS